VGLAKVYLVQESYDDAEAILKQGLDAVATTQKAPILFYLGKTAYVVGEGEPAATYLTQAIDQKLSEPEQAHYFRGLVYENLLKDTAKALEDYRASLKGASFDEQRMTEIKDRIAKLEAGSNQDSSE
jgi:tetratricopeptide (TPR) repeat protein